MKLQVIRSPLRFFTILLFLVCADGLTAQDGEWRAGNIQERESIRKLGSLEKVNGQTVSDSNTFPGLTEKKPSLRSLFKRFSIDGTWVPSGGDGSMGMTRLGIGTTIALPGPKLYGDNRSFFTISPKFGYTHIDWKRNTIFPESLYEAGISIAWMQKINDRWSTMLNVSPSWSGDGRATHNAVQCPTIFGLTWTPNPRWKTMFGVAYLGRSDIPFIPFGGLIWMPNEDWRVELMAPQAKIVKRLSCFCNEENQHWVYLGGGFGGGSWAFRSTDEQDDTAMYREFSVLLGYELIQKKTSWKVETGYLFGRKMKFDRNTQPDFSPEDALTLRLKCSF